VADGEIGAVEIRDGDSCPVCGHELIIARGIELGHVFQLGRKYADVFALGVVGPDGKALRVTMGSYGVGVSRAVAALAEQTIDEYGLRWPRAVAPADVHLVVAGKSDDVAGTAEFLAAALETVGVRVLLDDREGVSPGVKFRDAELIGVPLIVTVGRGLANGEIELRDRWSHERQPQWPWSGRPRSSPESWPPHAEPSGQVRPYTNPTTVRANVAGSELAPRVRAAQVGWGRLR
jgi:prolyl-tRNA synthetase